MDITAIPCYYVRVMSTKRPLETILKPDVQRVFDHFSACFNIRILFCSPSGMELNVGLSRSDSHYCQLVQDCLYGREPCMSLDKAKQKEAAEFGGMICYKCHAGLVEAIKPILYGDDLLGFVVIGQFRSGHKVPESVSADWQDKVGSSGLARSYARLKFVPQHKIDDILGLFSVLVDYMVSQHMVMRHGSMVVNDLVSYMESRPEAALSLQDAAEMVHKSPSTVSHLFKSKLGKSFKETQTEIKLKRAEDYLSADPEMTVAEAADKVGYSDPLYFSRIYKKYRGVAPSEFHT